MAEKLEHRLSESLECQLCLEVFKAPTLLACGHTFCKDCLDKYDKNPRGQDFMECPLCKKHTKLGENRVAGLSTNFSIKHLTEILHVHLKVNGKSSEYCSLHSQVYRDILCEDCNEFICLTCLFNGHQGHRLRKKEDLEAELKKKGRFVIQKSKEKKAQIKKSITNAEQDMRDMHSRLQDLDSEIEISYYEKSDILRGLRERLSQDVDEIRKKSSKVMTDFIKRQEHSLQSMDVKSINLNTTLMRLDGIVSPSTCKLSDCDAMKTRYIEFLDLENEVERDLYDPSVAQAKREVENTQFLRAYEDELDLGILEQETIPYISKRRVINFEPAMEVDTCSQTSVQIV